MSKCIAKDMCNCHKDSNGTLQCPEHSKRSYFDYTGEEIMEHINGSPPSMSEREKQWLEFSERVEKHLREYTVPQYGDVGEDLITGYNVNDCVEQVTKYTKRYGSQSREGQQELDFVKMAHYIQCAWEKYENYIPVVEPGVYGRLAVVGSEEDLALAQTGQYELENVLISQEEQYHFWKNKE